MHFKYVLNPLKYGGFIWVLKGLSKSDKEANTSYSQFPISTFAKQKCISYSFAKKNNIIRIKNG